MDSSGLRSQRLDHPGILNPTDLRKQIVMLFGPHVRKFYDLLE